MQIASSLNSIIIQKLIPTIDENLVCCMDILLASTAVKNLISKNQLSQLISQMQLNRQNGMQFIQDDIEKLVKAKLIDEKTGMYIYKTVNNQYISNGSKISNLKVKARFIKFLKV